jgi:hypothetical protein
MDCKYYAGSDYVRDINKGSYKTTKNYYVRNKTRSSHGFDDRLDPGGNWWSPTYSTNSNFSFHLGIFLQFFGTQTFGVVLRP